MKTFSDFMEQIASIAPGPQTIAVQKSRQLSGQIQRSHVHREMQQRANAEMKAKQKRITDAENRI